MVLVKLAKPKFSLGDVRKDHPELLVDDDPDKFFQEQQERLEASIRDNLDTEDRNVGAIEEQSGLERLAQCIRDLGIDLASPTELEELMAHLEAMRDSDEKADRHSQRTIRDKEDPQQWVSPIDCNAVLEKINTALDARQMDDSIISPPTSRLPSISSLHDIILLRARPSSGVPSTDRPTHFAVHKTFLAAQSSAFVAHASAHPTMKVFAVDADRYALHHVVAWLYQPRDYSLTQVSADRALAVLCVAIDIGIARLHDAVIATLIKQHTGFPEFLRFPKKFRPDKESVLRIYALTKKGDGARTCVAYLLALARDFHIDPKEDRELAMQVALDISQWEAKEKILGRWEKLPAEAFFSETGKRHSRKKGRS